MNAIQFYSNLFKFIQFYSIVSLLLPRATRRLAAVVSSVRMTSVSSWRRRRFRRWTHEAAPILFAEARFPPPLLPWSILSVRSSTSTASHRASARLSRTTQLKISHRKKEILCSIRFKSGHFLNRSSRVRPIWNATNRDIFSTIFLGCDRYEIHENTPIDKPNRSFSSLHRSFQRLLNR